MNSRFNLVIRPLEFANQLFLICYFALTIFTPLYSMQKMILLLGFWGLWFLTAIQIDPSFIKRTSALLLLIVAMLFMAGIASVMQGDSSVLNSVVNAMPNLAWAIVGIFYVYNTDILRNSKWILIVLIAVSSIYTLMGNLQYPEASRLLASTTDYYSTTRELYRSINIGGYGFVYSLVFAVMPILLLIKNNSNHPILLLACVILFIATIAVSAYMTAIIICSLMLVFTLIKNKKVMRILTALGLVVIVVLLFREQILSILVSLGEMTGADILVTRAQQLLTGSYFLDAGADQANRLTIFKNTILNWLDSPVVGNMFGADHLVYRRSGHSEMLGYLEKWGLFASVYFGFFRTTYVRTRTSLESENMRQNYRLYYLLLMLFITIDRFDTFIEIGCIAFFLGPVLMKMADQCIYIGETNSENIMAYQ